MKAKKVEAYSTKCSSCGDNMIFSPDAKALVCHSCSQKKAIDVDANVDSHPVLVNEETVKIKNSEWASSQKNMNCPNCGAIVSLPSYDTTATCPYCESHLTANKEERDGLKPDGIIPFAFGKEKAHELFKNKIKSNWLTPRSLKKQISADVIHAYYFPAFVFNASCFSSYNGRLYKNYTTKASDGRTVTERRYFSISGEITSNHSGIEIEASTRLSQTELTSVRPYLFKKAVKFSEEYTLGFVQECHSDSVEECYPKAQGIIKNEIRDLILKKYDYDGVQSLKIDTDFNNPTFSYYSLPMYRMNYTYKNKQYSNVMNGQTGSLGGKVPKSPFKICLIVIAILAIILLPFLLVALL